MNKIGKTFEELSDQEKKEITGSKQQLTTSSSALCFVTSGIVGGGVAGSITFILAAIFNK